MQKIMLVGMLSQTQYTYASSFARTLNKLGYRVITFNNRHQFFLPIPTPIKSIINDYLINQALLKAVIKHNPDILFLIKAENIFTSTLKYVKKKFKTKIINFYPDNPFVTWNGNSTPQVLSNLPHYDHFLIWSEMLIPALQSAGCKNVHYFPLAFEEELFTHFPEKTEDYYRSEVCFVGTWEPDRERWLLALCQRLPQLNLAIWGDLWRKHIPSNHILHARIRGPALYGKNMLAALQGADIVLNFIREQNATAHNMRTFEIPAAQSFMLTERTYEQAQKLFIEEESIACFSSIDELAQKITWYLQNPSERNRLVQAGHHTVQQYTLKKQLEKILDLIEGS